MRYSNSILLFFFLMQIGLQSCLNFRPLAVQSPPGCERLNDSLWIDKQPLMNLDYWEYLGWVQLYFGSGSSEFRAAFPDTTGHGVLVQGYLADADTVLQHKTYFVSPQQMEEQLAYVTLAQLSAYTAWRSDFVYENMLKAKKILPRKSNTRPASGFTIANFLSGRYEVPIPTGKKLPDIPVYSLPAELLHVLQQNPAAKINGPVRCVCRYVKPAEYTAIRKGN